MPDRACFGSFEPPRRRFHQSRRGAHRLHRRGEAVRINELPRTAEAIQQDRVVREIGVAPNVIVKVRSLAAGLHGDVRSREARREGDAVDIAIDRRYHQEALALRRSLLPEGDDEIAGSLLQVGLAMLRNKKPAEAEPLLREALEIRTVHPVPELNDIGIATIQRALGEALRRMARYDESEAYVRESFESLRAGRGIEDRNTLASLDALITLYLIMGRCEEAEQLRVLLAEGDALAGR